MQGALLWEVLLQNMSDIHNTPPATRTAARASSTITAMLFLRALSASCIATMSFQIGDRVQCTHDAARAEELASGHGGRRRSACEGGRAAHGGGRAEEE